MCPQPLSDYIAPFKLARQEQVLKGDLALDKIERFSHTLCSNKADISFEMAFGIDKGGTYFAQGKATAEVELECQRCMQAVPVVLSADIALAFFSSEKGAERVPSGYEPIVVKDEQLVLAELIEDELILALPIVAKHADENCQPKLADKSEALVEEKKNPFAVLAQLKKTTDE